MLNNTTTVMNIVAGDKGYELQFTLEDGAGNIVNITGASLTFNAQLENDGAVQFSGAMVIISAVAGTCYYLLTGTDFEVAGTYNCQIVASFSAGSEVMTFDGIQVIADSRIPQ